MKTVATICLTLFLIPSALWAVDKPQKTVSPALNIDSDSAVYDNKNQKVTFIGNVHVDNGDFKISSSKMYVHFDDKNQIKKIIALKNVLIRNGEQEARSDKAEFFASEGRILLTGEPQLIRGGDVLNSDKITFFRDSDRVETGKVNIVLQAVPAIDKTSSEKITSSVPVAIDADSAIYYGSKRIVKFKGNVKVNHDELRLQSGVLYIHLVQPQAEKATKKSNATSQQQQVDKLIAEIGVVIESPGRKSFSERATYFVESQKVILTGKPRLVSDNEELQSDKIIYYRNSSIIETGKTRIVSRGKGNPLNLDRQPDKSQGKDKK